MSPRDLEGSSPLFLSKSLINRDPKYCLEHLVTSDWQVFPSSCCRPRFLDGSLSYRLPLGWSACSQMPQAWPWCCRQYLPRCFSGGCLSKGSWDWGPFPHLYKVVPQHEMSLLILHPFISHHSWRLIQYLQLLKPLFFSLYNLCFMFVLFSTVLRNNTFWRFISEV